MKNINPTKIIIILSYKLSLKYHVYQCQKKIVCKCCFTVIYFIIFKPYYNVKFGKYYPIRGRSSNSSKVWIKYWTTILITINNKTLF